MSSQTTSPRVEAMNTTQNNNVKLANLISGNSGGRRTRRRQRRKRRTVTRRRYYRHRRRKYRGGAVVAPLNNSELYNVNSTNAGLTSISNQSTENMKYDNVPLTQ